MKPAVVFILYIIFTLLKNIKDNETTAVNISQLLCRVARKKKNSAFLNRV